MTEQALLIPCQGEQMVGILNPGPGDLGLLVVVGGPQYRAGSHRLFVDLCRQLAQDGITTLRFDVRGMGDSSGEPRSFEHLSQDIHAAIDALQRAAPHIRRVVLWGLCDGASAVLLHAHEAPDPRVAGFCLVNPWVRSPELQARTLVKHHYLQRLRQGAFWRKLLSGHLGPRAVLDFLRTLRSARASGSALPFAQRMALGLERAAVPALIILSGRDFTAREFEEHTSKDPAWAALLNQAPIQIRHHPNADHTHATPEARAELLRDTQAWVLQLIPKA